MLIFFRSSSHGVGFMVYALFFVIKFVGFDSLVGQISQLDTVLVTGVECFMYSNAFFFGFRLLLSQFISVR